MDSTLAGPDPCDWGWRDKFVWQSSGSKEYATVF